MIISASRRTDIPAFFAPEIYEALKKGRLTVANPFNPKQIRTVNLQPEAVDAIVFWTRYPKPLFKYLPQIDSLGHRCLFLFTITGYPESLEPSLPPVEKITDCFKKLSEKIGSSKVIWRYDPIVVSNVTDQNYHVDNFDRLAKILSGYSHKVIVSYLDIYRKLKPRFKRLSQQRGIEIEDFAADKENAIRLFKQLKSIADYNRFQIQSCAEDKFLEKSGIPAGACIDSDYLEKVFQKKFDSRKDPNQRNNCRCCVSIDIGSYNTCKFNCLYCYAIR
jgi:DNA repair photolyase